MLRNQWIIFLIIIIIQEKMLYFKKYILGINREDTIFFSFDY